MTFPVRAQPLITQMRRGHLPAVPCRHVRVVCLERPSGRNADTRGVTPITHHVAGPGANPRVEDQSKAGRPRAHNPSRQPGARTTNTRSSSIPTTPDHALDVRSLHK